ncbi:membrane protein [Egicoccus halophilus]|uniref:Membrane protein n=1 Tax=Egicoccus halophilus TaxID=1670830 RepID=A0A8J3EW66_9ACTN|nr:membrane protein [Egicoccus halophilus]
MVSSIDTAHRPVTGSGYLAPVVTGTLLNVGAIVVGALAGAALGGRLPARVRGSVTDVLGLFVVVLGIADALTTFGPELGDRLGRGAVLLVLGSLLVGGILGELVDVEGRLTRAGERLRDLVLGSASVPTVAADAPGSRRVGGPVGSDPVPGDLDTAAPDSDDRRARFVEGFVVTTLLVCVGPLAVLGAIEDGLTGSIQLLSVKSVLDGFAALAFASALGLGVAFAAVPLLVYQGGLTLAAAALGPVATEVMIAAIGAVGGFLVIGIGLRLLDLRPIRVANFLPALVVAPLAVALWP